VERENAFFKSSPVGEYHLPQMNSEKVFLGCRVPPIQISTNNGEIKALFSKFFRRIYLMALLFSSLGSRNKTAFSEFWSLVSQKYLPYKFRLRKRAPLSSEFYRRTNLTTLLYSTWESRNKNAPSKFKNSLS
jgi:hypothetical protein